MWHAKSKPPEDSLQKMYAFPEEYDPNEANQNMHCELEKRVAKMWHHKVCRSTPKQPEEKLSRR